MLLEGVPVELSPSAARWTRGLAARMRDTAALHGVDAVAEALIGDVAAPGTWTALPGDLRRMLTDNGPAILAELEGEWLQADAAAIATIELPVLLVGAVESPPELREPNDVMAAALPAARTVLVEGDHLIDPAGPAVLAFIEEVLGGPPR